MTQAPFPYFGGKATVAAEVWRRFGKPHNFVEPFCGSAAMLLSRPDGSWPKNKIAIETINDMDGRVANFWRVFTRGGSRIERLARWMNYPVCEIDLEARHRRLCLQPWKDRFLARMKAEPKYCSTIRAAWWCWGVCQWIGAGWCEGETFGPRDERNHGRGLCDDAAKRPHLGRSRGVHKQLPHLGDAGRGEFARREAVLMEWMTALADRLRGVRVCCGDWKRVCGSPATTTKHGLTAVFLDPPYSAEAGRNNAIYSHEDLSVAHKVREWCLTHTDNPKMRIALCGYEGEGHEELEHAGWDVWAWKANGGFGNRGDGAGKTNAKRERIWFSPACVQQETGLLIGVKG